MTKMALSALAALLWFSSPQRAGYAQEPPEEPMPPSEMVVPEGTVIPIVLTAYLNTRSSQPGDTLYADTTYPIWIQQRLVIPKGSTIRGTVTEVIRPGKLKGKGRLGIRFDDILLPNGVKRDLAAVFRGIHGQADEKLDRKSETVSGGGPNAADAGTVVGTTSTGAIIGAVTGGGTGTAIGAGAGAAAGIGMILFSRGRDLMLSPGTQFELELKRPMKFAYNEIDFTNAELNEARRTVRSAPPPRDPSLGRRRILPFPGLGIPVPIR